MTQSFWHPFADMAAVVSGGELVLDRGEGCYVWDIEGKRYLDATASLWYCNVGWGRREIGEAAADGDQDEVQRLADETDPIENEADEKARQYGLNDCGNDSDR